MLPAILAAGSGIAVSAAITYYFVSNQANTKREELTRKMAATLEVLFQKAEALKAAVRAREEALRAASTANAEMAAELAAMREELERTTMEMDRLRTEFGRWRMSSGTFTSGLRIIPRSRILYKSGWKHEKAIAYLDERKNEAQATVLRLCHDKQV